MFILHLTHLCLHREQNTLEHIAEGKKKEKEGNKQKIELASITRESGVTAKERMYFSSMGTVVQSSGHGAELQSAYLLRGTRFISFSKIASLSRMSRTRLLENHREYYCRVLRFFSLFKLAQQALQKSLLV